jgi:hypothetical protein
MVVETTSRENTEGPFNFNNACAFPVSGVVVCLGNQRRAGTMTDLEKAANLWDEFFDALADSRFIEEKTDYVLEVLDSLKCDSEFLDRRLVARLWFIPTFLAWNKSRCVDNNADPQRYDEFTGKVIDILLAKLGSPE